MDSVSNFEAQDALTLDDLLAAARELDPARRADLVQHAARLLAEQEGEGRE